MFARHARRRHHGSACRLNQGADTDLFATRAVTPNPAAGWSGFGLLVMALMAAFALAVVRFDEKAVWRQPPPISTAPAGKVSLRLEIRAPRHRWRSEGRSCGECQ